MLLMRRLIIVTGLLLFSMVILNCAGKKKTRGNPITEVTTNEVSEAKLKVRSRTVENYQETCLFLNESFRQLNTCSLSVQVDSSMLGVQAVGQSASFAKLPKPTTLSSFSATGAIDVGDQIPREQLQVGEIWLFKKKDNNVSYELVFEVTKIEADQITVKYKVTDFKLLW